MRNLLLLLSFCFCAVLFTACTNDEGDEDIDIITPHEEEESLNQAFKSLESTDYLV